VSCGHLLCRRSIEVDEERRPGVENPAGKTERVQGISSECAQ
jgi:hypothetical protein